MDILKGYKPENVLGYFEQITRIPRGSGNCKEISQFLVDFAKSKNLEYYTDELLNVVIKKPATKGYENGQTVILQAHMDMVCVKESDCTKHMTKEGIDIFVDGDLIKAKGTTLGADNGVGMAMILATLEDENMEHPAIEAVFTSDEETGMYGAEAVDGSLLKGKMLMNLDTCDEDVITVGCAGGSTGHVDLPVKREKYSGKAYAINIKGLAGGHSGLEIIKGSANSNKLMGRLLFEIMTNVDMRIISFDGGVVDNAIAADTIAVVACADKTKLSKICDDMKKTFKHEYADTDPNLDITLKEACAELFPMDNATTQKVVLYSNLIPNGVVRMSTAIKDLVQTSLNLGRVITDKEKVSFCHGIRSSVYTEREMLESQLNNMAMFLGAELQISDAYPGWEFAKESKLREIASEVYETIYNKKPGIEAIHAGLECGYFVDKIPGLDCISISMDLKDEHSPKEQVSIASIQRVWNLVTGILKKIK